MKKILVIDQGNSHTKLTVFDGPEPLEHLHLDILRVEDVVPVMDRHGIEGAIYSSVVKIDARFAESLRMALGGNLVIFTRETPLPISSDYLSTDTIGLDRLAGAVGAASIFPESTVLALDSGSALTADLISAGKLTGGNISPGLSMRFRALASFTGALPIVTYSTDDPLPAFGRTTTEAIRSGVVLGMTAEIYGWIESALASDPNAKIIMTGGHSPLLLPIVSRKFPATIHEPLLVAKGLNIIYRYNEKNL